MKTQLNVDLANMTTAELKELRKRIVGIINMRIGNEIHVAKMRLYVGARCKVNHPKTMGKEFIITKINQKNCVCREVGGNRLREWNIQANLLEIIE